MKYQRKIRNRRNRGGQDPEKIEHRNFDSRTNLYQKVSIWTKAKRRLNDDKVDDYDNEDDDYNDHIATLPQKEGGYQRSKGLDQRRTSWRIHVHLAFCGADCVPGKIINSVFCDWRASHIIFGRQQRKSAKSYGLKRLSQIRLRSILASAGIPNRKWATYLPTPAELI